MGLPLVQIYMIAARQLSKPIANKLMQYGADHPTFRNRFLIPFGKAITNWSTRLRMKNLGLGAPTKLPNVSDETALEQASEVVQQLTILFYSIGVFVAYYYYMQRTAKEVAYASDLDEFRRKQDQEIMRLNVQCTEMRDQLDVLLKKEANSWPNTLLQPWRSISLPNLPIPVLVGGGGAERAEEAKTAKLPAAERKAESSDRKVRPRKQPKTERLAEKDSRTNSPLQQQQEHLTISRTEAMDRLRKAREKNSDAPPRKDS